VTGPRSRRAREGQTSRSRKGSVAAEGTSILPTVLAFREAASEMDLGRSESARGPTPREQSRRRPGCPERHEEGTRDIVREKRIAFSRAFRPAACFGKSWLAGLGAATHRKANATGIGWCRRAAERELHSRARIEGSFGCARASYPGCRSRRASPRLMRSAYPVATERVNGSPANGFERHVGEKASRTCLAVAKPCGRRRPEPDARESAAGQRSLSYGRHLGPLSHASASRGHWDHGLGDSHSDTRRASANGAPESRDRGVRGASAHVARGRQRPPR